MVKKLSALALAGLLAMPAAAGAGGGGDLAAKIDQLSRELNALKAEMNAMKAENEEAFEEIDEKSEAWDLAARFKFSGDFRVRGDWYSNNLKTTPLDMATWQSTAASNLFTQTSAGNLGGTITGGPGGSTWGDLLSPDATTKRNAQMTHLGMYMNGAFGAPAFQDNDKMENTSLYTNRFRLNMRVKATENVEFKGRLAMYKTWGSQELPENVTAFGYPSFDGTAAREPRDSILRVDRAIVNWNNIGGQPVWFSIGRRPTTDGPAAQYRMGMDKRLATPTAHMDWPFDGLAVGYAYANLFGMEDWPGRVRFCYGRGFENGLLFDDGSNIDDTDFAGLSWDIYKKGNRFAYLESFMVFNAFNYPDFEDDNTEDFFEFFLGERQNIGDLIHTSAVYQDKWDNLNFFISGGWSHTMPDDDTGMFNDFLADFNNFFAGGNLGDIRNTDDEDGYNIWIGARYDMDDQGLKFGLEYNHGSQYWIAMSPGHDDLYSSKLATRGDVYEAYVIWDLPTGDAISKFAKTFMRFGVQYYDYDYTGGSDWNIKPYDLDDSEAEMWGALMPTIENATQFYATFEAYF